MAITPDAVPVPLSLNYVPGIASQGDNICVHAGDRLYAASLFFPGTPGTDPFPDGTPGAGAGFVPHFVYQPAWMRTQDVHEPPKDATKIDGLNGNASVSNVIRVDLGYLYCPWAGTVVFQGGSSSPASSPYLIAYGWDQHSRQTTRWFDVVWESFLRLTRQSNSVQRLKLPRFPADGRLSQTMRLTYINANQDINGNTFPIQRPAFSTTVWTPDAQDLILDSGPGTTPTAVRTNGESGSASLAHYTRITPNTKTATQVIFGITL